MSLYTTNVNKTAGKDIQRDQRKISPETYAHIYGNLTYDAYRSQGGKPEYSVNDVGKN